MNTERYTQAVPMEEIQVKDGFWGHFIEVARTKIIPYQWEALNDRVEGAAPSYCMRNFRVAAGLEEGGFGGCVFQDSDVAKWLEAVAYSLIQHPDPELEETADGAIDLIVSAQQPDGYLDTYYIINGLDQRWTNLRDNHELYCAGHMLEAAVAYWRATGKRKLLDAMLRYVDYIDSYFGTEEGKCHGYPGHEVLELALMKLYAVTGDPKHLKLAKYFIDQRGQAPLYFENEPHPGKPFHWAKSYFKYQYYQAGKPVREQQEAEGHAVRAVYLYSGMADVARETGDDSLYDALQSLWSNMTRRRMYITGSIGSSKFGEAFTYDYHLPNDTIYGETCAAIGLVFFAKRMLMIEPKGEYADVMERALYNGIISGMTLDGTRFFYVNPLEVEPEGVLKDEARSSVRVERQKWFGCACCPPNLARLMSSLPDYAYGKNDTTLFVHLYLGGDLKTQIGGQTAHLRVQTGYPWNGTVQMEWMESGEYMLALRIPGWCRSYHLTCNGEEISGESKDGYCYLSREWKAGDRLELELDMPVQLVRANPRVREDIGKTAVMRGPVVYCLEEADNGADLHRIRLGQDMKFTSEYRPDFLGGVTVLRSTARMQEQEDWDADTLYGFESDEKYQEKELLWIPYYAWANRSAGELMVWVRKEN